MPGTLKTEEKVYISLETSLGHNMLILTQVDGVECLSQPFEFHLEMYAHTPNLDVKKIMGQEATITFRFKHGVRYINGIIGEFVQGPTIGKPRIQESNLTLEEEEVTYYTAKLYPTFWRTQFNSDCRIFQNQNTLDITKKLFEEQHIRDVRDLTRDRGRKPKEYCVQYNESVFNFTSRLFETEGIFYFFEHTSNKHTLVLGDNPSSYSSLNVKDKIPYIRGEVATPPFSAIYECQIFQTTVPHSFASSDFNYTTPRTKLTAQTKGDGLGGEIFEYPGNYQVQDVGETITTLRIQEKENTQLFLKGKSTCPFFLSGYSFDLTNHERREYNTTYVLHKVRHKARYDEEQDGFIYENVFEAFPKKTPFRPPLKTPSPKIYGSQTAIVTGKKDEEIWTDNYSRIKVKFHWDRHGKDDETSSCWIRVATLWAGSQWGALYTPRIGQEVVISYLNGNPDRPLVTGSVYNADNMPPYRPHDPTKATLKSNTSKGKKGFNEFRFEDKKDHEEIYMHAQKDMKIDIINDRTTTLQKGNCKTTLEAGDRTTILQGKSAKDENPGGPDKRGNDFLTINKGNRTVKLLGQGSDKGTDTLEITKGDHIVTLDKGDETITLKEGNRTVKLSKGNETHEITGSYTRKVTQDYTLTVDGNLTIDVTGNITIKSGQNTTQNAGMNFSIKAGQNIMAESGMNTTLKSGIEFLSQSSMMTMKVSGIGLCDVGGILTLKGAIVTVNP